MKLMKIYSELNLRKNLLLGNIDVVDWGENNLLEFKNIFND